MKKFLLFLAVLLGGISAAYAQEVLTTNSFWGNSTSYDGTKAITSSETFMGSTWTAAGFANNSGNWNDYRCGSKNAAQVAYITNNTPINAVVEEFVINITYQKNGTNDKLNSMKLQIANNSDFTNPTEVVFNNHTPNQNTTAKDWTFQIPASAQGPNLFYKFVFDCPKSTNNGFLGVNRITAYISQPVKDVVIDYTLTGTVANVTLSCPTEGASIFYGFDADNVTTPYTAPFQVSERKTVYAKATKDAEGSNITNKFIDVPFTSFAAVYEEAANDDEITVIGDFEVLANGSRLLILTDGTTNIVLDDVNNPVYTIGTKYSKVSGKVYKYHGILEIQEYTLIEGGSGATYTAVEVDDLDNISFDNLLTQVVVKDATISGKIGDKATLNHNGKTIALYNSLAITTFENGDNYDVTGFVWRYDNTLQIVPMLIENGSVLETTKAPVISPNTRELNVGDKVSITCATADAKIYYTLDDSEPTESSTLYTAPFDFESDCTVKARAYADGMLPSEVVSRSYHIFDPYCNVINAEDHEGSANQYVPHTCTVDGVDYAMLGIHNKTKGIQMNNTSSRTCYIIQTAENVVGDKALVVKSIEFDFNENTKSITFTIRGANTPFCDGTVNGEISNIDTNGVIVGTISNDNTTVEFPKDYKYFSLYPADYGAVYMNSITINYRDAVVTPAPELSDISSNDFVYDATGFLFPELPVDEDWTPMYQVNDGDTYEYDPSDGMHTESLAPASCYVIKIWYEHYNGTDASDPVEFRIVTSATHTKTMAEGKTTIDFGTIGEGITIYVTLNGEDPTMPTAAQVKAARSTSLNGEYIIDSAEDLNKTHALTAATPKLVINHNIAGAETPTTLKHQAVHTSGAAGEVVTVNEVTTGIENVAVEAEEAVYYNLQGVRVANPENGVYVRVQGGKATKVVL